MRPRLLLQSACAYVLMAAVVSQVAAAPKYDTSGVVVHQCSCAYACPCMFENAPDDCALAAVYHVDSGSYDGVGIGGLSMISIDGAVASHQGGACCAAGAAPRKGGAAGVVYLDSAASPAQRRALLALLKERGEWPDGGRPVKAVPIAFVKTANGYQTTVPGLFRGETKQVFSRKGTPITVDGVGFVEGSRWTVGRSVVNDLHDSDLGLRWHLPNTNGSWSLWHWNSADAAHSEENAPVGRSSH